MSQEELNVGMHSTFDHFVTVRIKRDPYASLTYINNKFVPLIDRPLFGTVRVSVRHLGCMNVL